MLTPNNALSSWIKKDQGGVKNSTERNEWKGCSGEAQERDLLAQAWTGNRQAVTLSKGRPARRSLPHFAQGYRTALSKMGETAIVPFPEVVTPFSQKSDSLEHIPQRDLNLPGFSGTGNASISRAC